MRASFLLALLLGCGQTSDGIKYVPTSPRVAIALPVDGQAFRGGEAVSFEGVVDDDQDLPTELSIRWTSDLDGVLNQDPADGDGFTRFSTAALSPGTHVITLQVLDSDVSSTEDFVTIDVDAAAEGPAITARSPRGPDYGVEGVAFTFEALVSDEQDVATDLLVWFESDLDGVFCEPPPDADGLATCDAALSAGDHALTFHVEDLDGNAATVALTFSVVPASAHDADSDGYTEDDGDCDDGDPSVRPGASEYANGVDDDCDGEIDEGTSDADDDGDGFAEVDGDCDDGDADTFPGGLEVCDGVDNDCDLAVDDGTSCVDDDGDGYTETEGDCDDGVTATYPGAPELGDAADNDCDGTADEGTSVYDDDGDCVCEAGACTGSIDASCAALSDGDCDDAEAAVAPTATELCNDVDDDCDGTADEGAADAVTWYQDSDADDYGDVSVYTTACDAPPGYVDNGDDCDDTDSTTSPVALEFCNSNDDDCDGVVDEDDAVDAGAWYRDADGDTYGAAALTTQACTAPAGYVASATDCNDANATSYPGATEYCNATDDDCDGTTDESTAADATTWWRDADGDGYGGTSTSSVSCTAPAGYVASSTDCNDGSAAISPAASETCDSVDNDCDGSTDEGVTTTYYRDADGDGYGTSGTTTSACSAPSGYVSNASDCNDSSASVSPDTIWYRDSDGDGYGDSSSTRAACTQPSGYVSNDDDCNDATASASPVDTESCDGIDNDCDGTADEINATGCTSYYTDSDGDGYGATGTSSRCYCSATSTYTATNDDDCYDSNANANPAATAYYSVSRGDGSYDYNCDGSQSKRYTDTYDCTGAVWVCVDSSDGWTGSVPSCGSSSRWGTGCSADLTSCTYGSSSSRTQTCR
jgi:hypothetical protein